MGYGYEDDYEDDRPEGFMIIWTCDKCGQQREEPEGYNEGGRHHCGGEWQKTGESYEC